MDLALFDLDHTLLPLDSDTEWGRFLARLRVVDPEHQEREHSRFYSEYVAGTLDIFEFLEFQLAPLAANPRETLDAWHDRFMEEVIAPAILPSATELLDRHRERGDVVAIVTATNDFVTGPIARRLGVEHLIATNVEVVDGRCTGRVAGLPNYREGKVARTEQWLRSIGRDWDSFGRTWFYSDSANDIPLLSRVTNPIATNPDERLAAHARERGWTVLELFE
jgi:HAD superfamily hydrolase (TIGR01490 family)